MVAFPESPDRNVFAEEDPAVPSQPPSRPVGLTAISIILIVLGLAGMLAAVAGGVGMALNVQFQSWTPQPPADGSNPMLEAQAEMQKAMNDINRENQAFYAVGLVAHFIVAVLLIAAGVQLLRMRPSAEVVVLIAGGVAILFELARQVTSILVQLQMMRVFQEHLGDITGDSNPAGDFMSRMLPLLMMVGMVLGAFWTLGKIAFYAGSIVYVRKPTIRALLGS